MYSVTVLALMSTDPFQRGSLALHEQRKRTLVLLLLAFISILLDTTVSRNVSIISLPTGGVEVKTAAAAVQD